MFHFNRYSKSLVIAFAAANIPYVHALDTTPLKALAGDLITNYSGVLVADPYRALEDLNSPETRAWAKSQNTFTRQELDRLPGVLTLRAKVDAMDEEQSPAVNSVRVTARGQWFYLKRLPGENTFKLYFRATYKAKEIIVLDPDIWKQKDGLAHAINNFTISPDGYHVAAVVSKGDAELGELRIFNVRTRAIEGEPVTGIWGEITTSWSRDSKRFQYVRGQDSLKPTGTAFGKMEVWERRKGGGADRLLMGFGADHGAQVRERDWVNLDLSSSRKYTAAIRTEGVASMARLDVAKSDDLKRDPVHTKWTAILDEKANTRDVSIFEHWVYVLTCNEAPRYQLVRYDLEKPSLPPKTVIPQTIGVIDAMTVASDGVYVVVRTGSVSELWRLPHGAKPGQVEKIPLPFIGAVRMFDADTAAPGVVFALEGWTRERQIYYALGTKVVLTSLIPPSKSQVGSDWVAEEISCPSHDGVLVPMSIIYRRGMLKDGNNPTLIDGYGGYGVPEIATFTPKLDAWLQRGGIFVNVKPRGGGALGREWYQAGVGPRKYNTWKDMIACGQTLVDRRYTSPARLAIQGTSMGGVAVGRAITERPNLFAAAIVRVGMTDAVRLIEAHSNGPNHIYEMGSVKTADGIKQLLTMSTYHQITDGEKYPAVLFTTGMNDNRVAPWSSFKTYARMSAATSSGKPVLLRVEEDGGHGVSLTQAQRNSEFVDRLAFLLWNMGDHEFQPLPKH